MQVENSEGKSNFRKTELYGENELKGKPKSIINRDEHQSYSSDEESKRIEESCEDIEVESIMESENKRAI